MAVTYSRQAIRKWRKQFENGHTDDYRCGRLSTALTNNDTERVNELINIIDIRLKYRKICTRWVLRLHSLSSTNFSVLLYSF